MMGDSDIVETQKYDKLYYHQKFDNYFDYNFNKLENIKGIKFVDPNITIQALASTNEATKGILVKSILPKDISSSTFIT